VGEGAGLGVDTLDVEEEGLERSLRGRIASSCWERRSSSESVIVVSDGEGAFLAVRPGEGRGSASGFWLSSNAWDRPLTPPSPRERGEGE
jgi:hypothetical protein